MYICVSLSLPLSFCHLRSQCISVPIGKSLVFFFIVVSIIQHLLLCLYLNPSVFFCLCASVCLALYLYLSQSFPPLAPSVRVVISLNDWIQRLIPSHLHPFVRPSSHSVHLKLYRHFDYEIIPRSDKSTTSILPAFDLYLQLPSPLRSFFPRSIYPSFRPLAQTCENIGRDQRFGGKVVKTNN